MAVNKINGIAITTASKINGTTAAKVNGFEITAGGGGGPSFVSVFSDNFNTSTNGAALGSRSGWDDESSGLITENPGGAGYVRPDGGASLFSSICTASYNSDQYAEFEITAVGDGSAVAIGCSVRNQASDTGGYDLIWFGTGITDLSLNVRPNGGGGGSTLINASKSYSVGTKLRLYVTGAGAAARLYVQEDTGSGWTDVWTDQNPATDFDGGVPGLVGYGSSDTIRMDNFDSGNVT